MARIFSEDNNAVAQRELLVREGTARFADTAGENDPHLQKMLQKHQENSRAISYGTIPYLGTFLTDLTMIDTAIPDVVSDGIWQGYVRSFRFNPETEAALIAGENYEAFGPLARYSPARLLACSSGGGQPRRGGRFQLSSMVQCFTVPMVLTIGFNRLLH